MGNVCKCLRCCFCCICDSKQKKIKDKKSGGKPKPKPKSPTTGAMDSTAGTGTDSPKIDVQLGDDEQTEDKDKGGISPEKLKEEVEKAFKAGTKSSYGSVRATIVLRKRAEEEVKYLKRFSQRYGLEVMQSCGSGRYSEVYKVSNTSKGRTLAVKVINTEYIGDNYRTNFLPNELKILRSLPVHLNIIRVFRFQERWKRYWIIMEFAKNGSLSDYLADKGALTEKLSHFFFKGIVSGLHEFHRRSIGHRDLKLENILLGPKHVPKISDFSYAIEVNPNKPTSDQYCGTIIYMPPEMLQRIPYNPLISDIWSLGICFYTLLNDGFPFKTSDKENIIIDKQLKKKWYFRKRVEPILSTDIKDIIKSMLEPTVNLRTKTADLLLKPWFRQN